MRAHHAVLVAALATACGGSSDTSGTAPVVVASVAIAPHAAITTFTPGSKIGLTASVLDANGAPVTSQTPTWTTTNAAVLSVSPASGVATTVTASATGAAMIIATAGGKADTVSITVVAQVLTAVSVSPPSMQLAPATTQGLVVRAVDQNGIAMTGTGFAPVFTSSSAAVATVDANGTVTAVANGSATITASVAGNGVTKSATSSITVAAGGGFPLSAAVQVDQSTGDYGTDATFSWDPSTIDIAVGGTVTFTNLTSALHTVTYSTATGAPANISTWGGGNQSSTFTTAGTFNYACSIHPYMTGVVVVH